MASVLEYLGIKIQPTETPVSKLGIHSDINLLQRASEKYFTIPDNALAADSNKLAVRVMPGQKFCLNNAEHSYLLAHATELFNDKSTALKELDQDIMTSILVGVAASTLSFLPFVGYFSWLGWGAALYCMKDRAMAYHEYSESLTLLVATCNWSLGESGSNTGNELVGNPAICEMMTALYAVLTETQLKHIVADEIEALFVAKQVSYEHAKNQARANGFFQSIPADENMALSKKCSEFQRCIYGFNKGNTSDFVDAFISAIPDLYNVACHGVQKLQQYWSATPTPAQNA